MTRLEDREFRDALSVVCRTFKSASADAMRRLDIHVGQNFLLEQLWLQDSLTAGELARRIGVEAPTITRMSKRMEGAGLLTRRPDDRDGRVTRIALTPRGRALRGELPALLDGIAQDALADLTAEQRTQLVDLLKRVAATLTAGGGFGDHVAEVGDREPIRFGTVQPDATPGTA